MSGPKFTQKLANKKVLIVGGSTGIGRAIAHGVLELGGIAIISSSSPANIETAIEDLSTAVPSAADRIYGSPIDLSTSTDLDTRVINLLEYAKNAHNGSTMDHIVFTAGNSVTINGVKNATVEDMQQMLQVRVLGATFIVKHASQYMTEGPGSSVTMTTGNSADRPMPGWSLVAGLVGTSLIGLTRGFAVELQPRRANLISLGITETDILAKVGLNNEAKEAMVQQTLTKKIGSPYDVAEAYLYVMKDSGITGQTITTDGGRLFV